MFQRMMRAARLDVAFYEMVEADASYTKEAFWVVLLVSAVSGLGASLAYGGVGGFFSSLFAGLIGWIVWAAVTLWIGTTITKGPETSSDMGEMLRVLGYSYTPQLLGFFVFIPILGALLAFIGAIWQLVAGIVAIRQALDFTTTRAVITVVLAWIALVIVNLVIALLFGAGAATLGAL